MSKLSVDEIFDNMRSPNGNSSDGQDRKPAAKPKNHILERHTPHKWLDEYIEYSRSLSPRAFDLLHEACGIWVLSAVAAGRVELDFGGAIRHAALMMTVIAPSSRWAKSHTVKLATRLLADAGLEWRGLPTKSTPAAIIEEMADNAQATAILEKLNFGELSEEEEAKLRTELDHLRVKLGNLYANEGQRYWHVSEFGTKIVEAMRPNSPMAEFSDFFRDVNEKKTYTKKTRGHGNEVIHDPFLAIMGDTTPADLAKYTRPHSPLWSNGFFPRFIIVTMSNDELKLRQAQEREGVPKAQVPYGFVCDETPIELIDPLVEMEQSLDLRMNYEDELLKKRLHLESEIYYSFYEYEAHIDKFRIETEDLDGTYTRLGFEQCPAVAMLLALADGSLEVEMKHFLRAQEFCERVRLSTESFYKRATDNTVDDKSIRQNLLEEKLTTIIKKLHKRKNVWPTQNEIRVKTGRSSSTRLPHSVITEVLQGLKMAGVLVDVKIDGYKSIRWQLL